MTQQLPEITKQIGNLAQKVYDERLKCLTDNEKYISKGFEDDDESDDGDADFEDDDDENPNAEFAKIKSALMGMKNGKPAAGDNFSDDDDSEDADYEETAGEYALYDSPLENTDELI